MYDDERSDRVRVGRRPGSGGEAPAPAIAAGSRAGRRAERVGVVGSGVVGHGLGRAGLGRAGLDRVGLDQAGLDRAGFDRAGFDRAGFDRAGAVGPGVGGVGVGGRPRRAPGPRPVRPAAVLVPVRPAQGERPVAQVDPGRRVCPNRQRTLVRRSAAVPLSTAGPGRRLLGGVLVAVLAAAVVVGLGQLLALTGAAEPAPAAVGSAAVGSAAVSPAAVGRPAAASSAGGVVTVGSEETVWEVARRIEPTADGARQAAVAERIAVANALTSVELRPGQVLWVPAG